MACQVYIQIVREQRLKLHAEQTSLGKKCPVLLHYGEEMRHKFGSRRHDSLSEERADLRSANIKDIAQARHIGKSHIRV